MRREFECETSLFFLFFFIAYVPPPPSLLASQKFKTPFHFRNKRVETVVVDHAPPLFLKFIHLAMKIIINESLLKEKKTSDTHFGRRKWGAFLFHLTLGTK